MIKWVLFCKNYAVSILKLMMISDNAKIKSYSMIISGSRGNLGSDQNYPP